MAKFGKYLEAQTPDRHRQVPEHVRDHRRGLRGGIRQRIAQAGATRRQPAQRLTKGDPGTYGELARKGRHRAEAQHGSGGPDDGPNQWPRRRSAWQSGAPPDGAHGDPRLPAHAAEG